MIKIRANFLLKIVYTESINNKTDIIEKPKRTKNVLFLEKGVIVSLRI